MKYSSASFIYLFAFISTLGVFNSCETSNKSPKAYFEIWDTTRIGDKMYLVNAKDEQLWEKYYRYADSGIVDSTGQVSFAFHTDSNSFWKVVRLAMPEKHNSTYFEYVTANPGDTLKYFKNGRDSVWAYGSLAGQIYLSQAITDSFFSEGWRQERNTRYAGSLDSFINYLYSRTDELNEFIRNYGTSNTVSPKYLDYLRAHCKWMEGHYYARYVEMHAYYAGEPYRYLFADSTGLDFSEYIKVEKYPFDYYYREVLNAFVKDLYQVQITGLPDSAKYKQRLIRRFEIIKNHFDGIQRDILLSSLAGNFYSYVGDDSFFQVADTILNYLESQEPSPVYLDYYKKELARYKRIEPEAPAPDFSLPDTAGNLVTLSDFEGKVVYINFWGTWCWPCIQSIPDHKALHDTFAYTDKVIFLNVSMEYDEEDINHWKDFIKERDFFGKNVVNVVGQKQTRDPRYEPYGIRAAPTYVLIDRQGRIAKPRADYPTNAIDDIRKLLVEKS